jgi:hypothetical protein
LTDNAKLITSGPQATNGGCEEMNENNYLSFMTDIDIYIKLASLPDDLKRQVGDFVEFLKSKTMAKEKSKTQRKAGLAKGLIEMKEGFDDPLDDFKEYM